MFLDSIYLILLASHACSALTIPTSLRGNTRFFLDTADVSEWIELLPLGIFHGITTNPILLERAGHPCTVEYIHELAQKALALTGEIMCQAWGETSEEMYQIGMQLSEIERNRIVIKVPVTADGTKASSKLIHAGVRVCLTACYSSSQALLASGVGAEYLAPYLGRMTDHGIDGMNECIRMQQIISGLGSQTRVLVASIRDIDSMAALATYGLDTFTFSPDIARALFKNSLTEKAASDFESAATRCTPLK